MKRSLMLVSLAASVVMVGCMPMPPKPNDPYYAPVLPRTPLPATQTNGAIYQADFDNNYFTDRKAFRVGDIITISLNERTQRDRKSVV